MDQVGSPRQRLHTLTELQTFLVEHDYDGSHRDAITAAELSAHDHDDLYYTEAEMDTALGLKADASALATKVNSSTFTAHTGDTANPHVVTKTQVGLANVDNTSDANKPVSTATQTALNLKADATHTHDIPFFSGRYYGTFSSYGVGVTSSLAMIANTHYASPFYVPKTVTIDRIGLEVTTLAAASTIRLAIYSTNTDGTPNALVLDAGTVDSSTTGAKEITISQVLNPGWYYLVSASNGIPSTNAATSSRAIFGASTPGAATFSTSLLQAKASPAMTATFGWTGSLTTSWRIIGVRAA